MRREEGRRVGGGPEGRRVPLPRVARLRLIYRFIPKVEELVDRSKDKIGTDVAYRKITAMGYRGRSCRPSRPSRRYRMPPGGLGGGGTSVDPGADVAAECGRQITPATEDSQVPSPPRTVVPRPSGYPS